MSWWSDTSREVTLKMTEVTWNMWKLRFRNIWTHLETCEHIDLEIS